MVGRPALARSPHSPLIRVMIAAELERFSKLFGGMTARELDGHLRSYLCNKARGVLTPEYMQAIREVTERRYLEIEEWRAEYKRGPKRAWEEGAAERIRRSISASEGVGS